MEPMASSGDMRAWISSSASKICCCSLSRISAARVSIVRIRSKETVELLLSFTGVAFVLGRGVGADSSHRQKASIHHPWFSILVIGPRWAVRSTLSHVVAGPNGRSV